MTHFSSADLDQLKEKGISLQAVERQLEQFRTGFPYLQLDGAATEGAGVLAVTPEFAAEVIANWKNSLPKLNNIVKFVPASGAASRMFKDLFAFVNGDAAIPADGSAVAKVCADIEKFAFYPELSDVTVRLHGKTPVELIAEGRHKDVIAAIILPEGLNYGQLPKALLSFHSYADGSWRTPLEEQLVEGAQTIADANRRVAVHFTVSADHRALFEKKLAEVVPALEEKLNVHYDISLSEQKPSTDTIAVTPDNELFRDDKGRLVFRPGGHGALIENLNDLDETIAFIKNIDNVVPDAHRDATVEYKQLLGGLLLYFQSRLADYAQRLEENPSEELVAEVTDFLAKSLFVTSTELAADKSLEARTAELLAILNRPLRIAGVVRNEGEPGGGPYLAHSTDGRRSAGQILESTQIDMANPEAVDMMKGARFFNPVDLVCYLRDTKGGKLNLLDFVDPSTGFISSKSFGGRELRALELPGLWNGAMSDWNTVFVEVPAATFNPVKTVNDLLRPAHQQ